VSPRGHTVHALRFRWDVGVVLRVRRIIASMELRVVVPARVRYSAWLERSTILHFGTGERPGG